MLEEEGKFILDTDPLDYAIGSVLTRLQGGQEKVVSFASWKLARAEANYCTMWKELLSIVNFVKYYKHFLLGRPFTVRTDHAALKWLRRIPESVEQQACWIGFLEEFEFNIVRQAGTRHTNADAPSRMPCQSSSGCCAAAVRVADEEQLWSTVGQMKQCRRGRRGNVFYSISTVVSEEQKHHQG